MSRPCRLLGLSALSVLLAACGVDAPGAAGPTAFAPGPASEAGVVGAPGDAPPGLVAGYIAAVQRSAPVRYRVERSGDGAFVAANSRQAFTARLDRDGATVTTRGARRASITALAVGCEGALAPLPAAEPEAAGNRVEYRRGAAVEWYVHGPLGLEHGFTLRERPRCEGTKVVALAFGGDLRPEPRGLSGVVLRDARGHRALAYTDLAVKDARGKALRSWMSVAGDRVSLNVDDAGAAYPIEIDPLLWSEEAMLSASDGAGADRFGVAVAISGNTAVIGAQYDDLEGGLDDAGSAYIFVGEGGVWTEQAKLTASDAQLTAFFGCSVGISGDTVVVGARLHDEDVFEDAGAAYVFVRSGDAWTEQAKLIDAEPAQADRFGQSVAIDGDTIVVGVPDENVVDPVNGSVVTNGGAAQVFVRNGRAWELQAEILANVPSDGDRLGSSVAVAGDALVAGAIGYTPGGAAAGAGAAYVFVRSGVAWTEEALLLPSDGMPEDEIGASVAIDEGIVVVGAPLHDVGGSAGAGAAYVFARDGGAWTEEGKLLPATSAPDDQFGFSVAVRADRVLVGAPLADTAAGADAGRITVFARSAGAWIEEATIEPAMPEAGAEYGASVALDAGGKAVVGARQNDVLASNSGAAYILESALTNGEPCVAGGDCASGFCVDGVCCDTACGDGAADDCQACSQAAGAPGDGTCRPAVAGTECRAAAGECDAPEACDGAADACPADAPVPDDTECTDGTCQSGVCEPAGEGGGGGDGSDDGGCGCRLAGVTDSEEGRSAGAGALLALALGLLLRGRRRPVRRG